MSIHRRLLVALSETGWPLLLVLALYPAAAALAADKGVAKGDFRPTSETYICPNVTTLGVDCFLDAVPHLYTMCRHVKSIEIIEFGYDAAEEGVNGLKSASCVDKQKLSMAKPLHAALRETSKNLTATEAIKSMHALWLQSLAELKWRPPETDQEYKERVDKPYGDFREQMTTVRTALVADAAAVKPGKPAAPTRTKRTASADAAKHGGN